MVSVFLEAIPANLRAAEALCEDNAANNATFCCVGMLIRIRGDERLIFKRAVIEAAVGRGLTENEWESIMLNYLGVITQADRAVLVFENSAESKVMDEYWDKRLAGLNRKT
jgi:hypothetical protein